MIKKYYDAPEAEFEVFTITDVVTASAGIGDGGNDGPDLDAVGEADAIVIDSYSGEVKYYLDQNAEVHDAQDVESIY